MKRIGVATFARSEYSSLRPVLDAIEQDSELDAILFVSGMHLLRDYGYTVAEIQRDGYDIAERVQMPICSDSPEGIAKSIGLGTIGFAEGLARRRPDVLILAGDRAELLAATSAALPFNIPIAHISGGDVTEGAVDNQVRHAVSKMSHLHFVAMELHAERLRRMGEEPWRIHVTGDPALDMFSRIELLSQDSLESALDLRIKAPLILVTYHPTTLSGHGVEEEIEALLSALKRVDGTFIITAPNADLGSSVIIERLRNFVVAHPRGRLFSSVGQQRYYSFLAHADLMVGNSSSGLWEAPSFHLPVVNIGDRQRGRLRIGNVIDVPVNSDDIYAAMQRALDPAFRAGLSHLTNPYGDGHAAERIMMILKRFDCDLRLLQKRYVDMAWNQDEAGGKT